MKNFELKVIKNGEQNELVYIKINRNVYTKSNVNIWRNIIIRSNVI